MVGKQEDQVGGYRSGHKKKWVFDSGSGEERMDDGSRIYFGGRTGRPR